MSLRHRRSRSLAATAVAASLALAACKAAELSRPQPVCVLDLPALPPGPALFFAGFGGADPAALRGDVTVTVAVARHALSGTGRVEVWLAGRLAASAPLPRFTPGEPVTRVPLTVNTAARDQAGAALYPNGVSQLQVRVASDGVAAVAGCPATPAGPWGQASRDVTLANP